MKNIRITKKFHFEMAHALYGYDGQCKNVHGHSYKLDVTVKGQPLDQKDHIKTGMVMDFTDLKAIVKPIVQKHDHATILNGNTPHRELSENNLLFSKLVLVDYQPTSENIVIDFAQQIITLLPSNVKLHHIRLQETASSYAEWFAEDNQ
jgi:6-pyruvoyltetrahydropterin/6-carboxytetrahydropterin synthase